MNKIQSVVRLRQLLMLLIVTLTFEGVARKALPAILGVPIFLTKDAIIMAMGYFLLQAPPAPPIEFLKNAYGTVVALFTPLILVTCYYDPLLAVYGCKQYLLYPIVGFTVFHAFQNQRIESIVNFFKWCAVLVLPTALVSMLELRLAPDHWLNRTVIGDDMEGFSAGGFLRVSSTFSFVAQYCMFLNAQVYLLSFIWCNLDRLKPAWKFLALSLVPLYVLSCFITGSRGAVVGTLVVMGVAFGLAAMKMQLRLVMQMIGLAIVLYLTLLVVQFIQPDAFAAYSARENGNMVGVSSENQWRMLSTFTAWVEDDRYFTLLGHGVGVMSNGSDTISQYAAGIRATFWTENDFSTTLYEGGFYLVFVWYIFRGYIIYQTVIRFIREVKGEYAIPTAVCLGFVVTNGVFGALALQPPNAIWWWISVGMSLLLWWKSTRPAGYEEQAEEEDLPPPPKGPRGRSLYADALHSR